MTGDMTGAAADVATGALVGHAVDAGAGGHGAAGGLCLNCGTRRVGGFCHACGQPGDVHRTVGAIGHDLAHGVFHFEGRIWRTLPMLVRHPGALTRRYVTGERQRFVSPLALFLFTVFLLFATMGAVGGEWGGEMRAETPASHRQVSARLTAARQELARADAARTRAIAAGQPTDDLDEQRDTLRTVIGALSVADDGGAAALSNTPIHTSWARLDHGIAKARANPGLALYKLQSSAYKYSWGLIPLSTPFVALLFLWRRGHTLYDHAVFVTYSIAFMMLLGIVLTLAGTAGLGGGWIVWPAVLVPPVHMFAQLRGAYRLRRWSAAWRTVALLLFAFTVLLGWTIMLLLHGLAE